MKENEVIVSDAALELLKEVNSLPWIDGQPSAKLFGVTKADGLLARELGDAGLARVVEDEGSGHIYISAFAGDI